MNRRRFVGTMASAAAWGLAPVAVIAGELVDGKATLRDRLRAGLLCRRDEEFDFVDHVVDLVNQKKLSQALVLSTYQWAVKQRPEFPFYYFQYGIRLRAKAIGVQV
jgi:hypothetical protein